MVRTSLLIPLALAVIIAATESCQDIGTTPPDGLVVSPPDTVLFQTNVYPLFSKYGCNGCHTGTEDISWYGSPSFVYSNFVNVNATRGACAGDKRVAPGSATTSVLYRRLSGFSCGDRMPFGGNSISAADLILIRDWINQGAVNN